MTKLENLSSTLQAVNDSVTGELGLAIFNAIEASDDGLTCFDMDIALGVSYEVISGCVTKLRAAGAIYQVGLRPVARSISDVAFYKPVIDLGSARLFDPECGFQTVNLVIRLRKLIESCEAVAGCIDDPRIREQFKVAVATAKQ